ncbi:MAG: N-acetylneuraminate synthase family protein [Bacteroidia bacterium]|nr:N-acetylneuraminate synthase family protein [Bacteroidia bacterium]
MKIIAESASNHNGSIEYLLKLAEFSKSAGANYFTFQIIDLDSFCEPEYERRMIVEKIIIPQASWTVLVEFCTQIGLEIIPCPLDMKSLNFISNFKFDFIKVHATDLLNTPLLERISTLDYKIILETQCATISDIEYAISILGYSKIECIMHGFSNYPTEGEDLNLGAINDIRERFSIPVGIADHSLDIEGIPLLSLGMGIKYLEKHITCNRNDRNYDWQVSLNPDEFKLMVLFLLKYEKTFGKGIKHPVNSELEFRNILYKRYVKKKGHLEVKRSDTGYSFHAFYYLNFKPDRVIATIIARLKSKRLRQKIFLPLKNDSIIFDLAERLKNSRLLAKAIIATSFLDEDSKIISECDKRGQFHFSGDPLIVIHRMLTVCESERSRGVFRITGDNPFTDPFLMDEMIQLFLENNLDYVRAGNVPLGVSAELYSISYLQKLYQEMEDPRNSEYLTWYVIQDRNAKKGIVAINLNDRNYSNFSLTVDTIEDYHRALMLIEKVERKKFSEINLIDILSNLRFLSPINKNYIIKLPRGTEITFGEFISLQENQNFSAKKTIAAALLQSRIDNGEDLV